MKNSRTSRIVTQTQRWIWPLLIAIPFIIGLSWGNHFQEEVYVILRYARNLASGLGLTYQPVGDSISPPLTAPLLAAFLSLTERSGFDTVQITAVVSLLGWSVVSLALFALGTILDKSQGGLIAALLVSFNPWIITTLGEATSWIIALIWISIALLVLRRYIFALLALFLLVALIIPWPVNSQWSNLVTIMRPFIWSSLLFSAAVGAQWLAEYLTDKKLVRINYQQTVTIFTAALIILLGSFQLFRLWQLYQERPIARWQLENNIVSWLHSNTNSTATLISSEKIGYLAQRQTFSPRNLLGNGEIDSFGLKLQSLLPNYLITDLSLSWQNASSSTWFRLNYQPVKKFPAPYVANAPNTVWVYRPSLEDLEPRQAINARVPDRLQILGYQIGPGEVKPGEQVKIALYLQAPAATAWPDTPFKAIVRLISIFDGQNQTEWEVSLPQSLPASEWQPGQVIIEKIVLPLPENLDYGAYQFNLSFLGTDSEEFWPISLDNDINRLDRIPLGNVAIPWSGNMDQIQPLEAKFGDHINLLGYSITDAPADLSQEVTLYWQADQIVDKDYTVFVHILDESGRLFANHDSQPANGGFPTTSWREEMIIPDQHLINLPDDLPAGEYQIMVGLYLPETGERLPVFVGGSTTSSNDALLLEKFKNP